MMTETFETLIYTDCRPGEGLQGTAGLQFQACSAGVSEGARALVQRNLLYEAPANWTRERRAAADYPPSFSHIAEDFFATANGIYLGKEVNGGREGNHLTHAILTDDPQSYGLIRPAQLFQASFWLNRPLPTTRSPRLSDGWQPGTFGPAETQDLVRSHPHGAELLTALLAALLHVNQPGARRILFISRESESVLRWLTAATLLIPQDQAVRIGFKVFTTSPSMATQPVIAIHPDWASSSASVEQDLGYLVFDLVTDRWSKTAPHPQASRWAELFLTEDPYDVMDAVEFTAVCGLPFDDAFTVAAAAMLHWPPGAEQARTIVRWLDNGPLALVKAYGPGLLDLLLAAAHTLPAVLMAELDRSLRGLGLQPQGASIRLALVRAELALAGTQPVTSTRAEPLPAGQWNDDDAGGAQQLVIGALRTARLSRFADVLTIAGRFGVPVNLAEAPRATDAFIIDWAAHRGRNYDHALWDCWPDLQERLRQRLMTMISEKPEIADDLGEQWASVLRCRPDLGTRFDQSLAISYMQSHSESERQAQLSECLAAINGGVPSAATSDRLADILFRSADPTPAELRLLVHGLRDGTVLDQQIFERLIRRVLNQSKGPQAGRWVEHAPRDQDYLDVCQELIDRRLLQPRPELLAILGPTRQVRTLISALGMADHTVAPILEQLEKLDYDQVMAHWNEFLVVLITGSVPPPGVVAVLKMYYALRSQYADMLSTALRSAPPHGPAAPSLAITAFCIMSSEPPILDSQLRDKLLASMRDWINRVPARSIQQATACAKKINPTLGRRWQRELDGARRPGAVGQFRRLFYRTGR
jgi:GTPase-associated protein 1, C-terminal domain/GTPase-associated protein 1, N-terminal domain type 2/GTPase-associated protein 1, middle domain